MFILTVTTIQLAIAYDETNDAGAFDALTDTQKNDLINRAASALDGSTLSEVVSEVLWNVVQPVSKTIWPPVIDIAAHRLKESGWNLT